MTLKNLTTLRTAFLYMLTLLGVATLTACGGGPMEADDLVAANTGARTGQAAALGVRAGLSRSSSSDFNAAIWDQHAWYECDCSRTPSPTTGTPWKATN